MPSRQAGTPSPTVVHACVFIFLKFFSFLPPGPARQCCARRCLRRALLVDSRPPPCRRRSLLHAGSRARFSGLHYPLPALLLRTATTAVVLPVECGFPCCLSHAGEAILSVRARVALCAPHHPLAYANTSHAHVLAEHTDRSQSSRVETRALSKWGPVDGAPFVAV